MKRGMLFGASVGTFLGSFLNAILFPSITTSLSSTLRDMDINSSTSILLWLGIGIMAVSVMVFINVFVEKHLRPVSNIVMFLCIPLSLILMLIFSFAILLFYFPQAFDGTTIADRLNPLMWIKFPVSLTLYTVNSQIVWLSYSVFFSVNYSILMRFVNYED